MDTDKISNVQLSLVTDTSRQPSNDLQLSMYQLDKYIYIVTVSSGGFELRP
jgi:hypothetical protein